MADERDAVGGGRRYPYTGFRLAPRALRDLLAAPTPEWVAAVWQGSSPCPVTLAELDAGVWEALTPDQCQDLGARIYATLHPLCTPRPSARLANQIICSVPLPVQTVAELPCSARLRGRLRSALGSEELVRLIGLTLGEFLRVRGVGAVLILELLVLVEELAARCLPAPTEPGEPPRNTLVVEALPPPVSREVRERRAAALTREQAVRDALERAIGEIARERATLAEFPLPIAEGGSAEGEAERFLELVELERRIRELMAANAALNR